MRAKICRLGTGLSWSPAARAIRGATYGCVVPSAKAGSGPANCANRMAAYSAPRTAIDVVVPAVKQIRQDKFGLNGINYINDINYMLALRLACSPSTTSAKVCANKCTSPGQRADT